MISFKRPMISRLLLPLLVSGLVALPVQAASSKDDNNGKNAKTKTSAASKGNAPARNSKSSPVAKKSAKPLKSQAMKETPKTLAAQKAARETVVSATAQKPSRLLASKKRRDNPPDHWGEWNGPAGTLPGLHSHAALLLDMQNGEALYQKNATQIVPIASITKLMTAMVMLDAHLPMNEEFIITDDDVDTLKGSRSRLAVGTQLTRQEALLLALMSSENRAAHALGRNYPGGIPAFVAAMNRKAQELGMTNTRFLDPTGLNSGNVSTARDLAKMVTAAAKYAPIREASTTSDAKFDVRGRMQEYRNTNPLVRSDSWDIGLTKTGFIREAGKCLVMQAKVNNRPMVFVLLDSEGSMTRVGDANRLKKWVEATRS
jgi:serine-type D-Ala-D-Ala endopeptidase (penicillin-binding protein 7)